MKLFKTFLGDALDTSTAPCSTSEPQHDHPIEELRELGIQSGWAISPNIYALSPHVKSLCMNNATWKQAWKPCFASI
jgi:hypothetical protein